MKRKQLHFTRRECWKRFALLAFMFIGFTTVFGQTVTLNTGLTGNTSAGTGLTAYITFVIRNNSSTPIRLLKVGNWASSADGAYTLYYSTTATSGPVDLSNASLWSTIPATGSVIPSATYSIQEVLTNINFMIPANATYRFAVQKASGTNYYTTGGVNTYTNGGVSLLINDFQIGGLNVGYGGGNSPRSFCGFVTYEPVALGPNNASVSGVAGPGHFCANTTQDIKVRVKNNGTNVINNVTVNWSIDGITQTPISWTSPLDSLGGTLYPNDTAITLGSEPFGTTPRNVIAWTTFPNSVTDTVTNDDSLIFTLTPALNGTYTVGGASADFATMAAAVNTLNAGGICGPVVFNVDSASGPYTANLNLSNVKGTSSVNTIVFNGNGSIVTSSNTPTLGITGTAYTTFDRFNITNSGSGVGVFVGGGSHHLTFTNNTITTSTTATATSCAAFVASGSSAAPTTAGNNLQNLTFTNNIVTGGYYSFTLMGNASYLDNYGHYIANNTFKDFYLYGVYLVNADTLTLLNNDINRATRAGVSTLYGIYLSSSRNLKIQKNRLHDFGVASYSCYPIYITNCVNSAGYESEISNNAIYKAGTTAIFYGIYSLTTAITGFNIFHNTIQHDVAAASTSAIRGANFTVAITNVKFQNNIISITGGGTGVKTGIYVTTASATFTSNNNVINVNTTASNNIGYWAAVQTTLANWQTASGQDLASVSVDPMFLDLAGGRLQPKAPAARGIGTPLGFTSDIVGNLRSSSRPDPGAFESIKSYNDAGVRSTTALLSCSSLQDVKVNLINYGKNQLNSVTVEWTLNGAPQIPHPVTFMVDTSESVAGDDTVIVIGQFVPSFGINDTIVAWTSMPNGVADTTTYNDSIMFVMKPGFAAGTYSVGPGGSYATISAALAAMSNGVCGPVVLELMTSYTSATETFPLVFPESANPVNTFTVRPQAGATGLSITGNNATTIIDLNKARYVTIDGRPGGTGSVIELSIVNTSTAGASIRFINGAGNNTLKYLTITGSNATAASGVVVFAGTTGTVGNNNNLIDNCNINGNSASVNCIYAMGSAAPADNTGNTITNNNIYDFFANVASTDISGIALMGNCTNWNIGTPGNGNRIYQTAARNASSTPALTVIGLFKGIYINGATVGGCSIVGNRIGGNIPGVPGSVFIIGDAATSVGHTLRLIDNYASSATMANSIQGNTISDITFSSTVSNAFIPIHARSGIVNVGNITGNIIGSQTGTGSLNVFHNNTNTGANAYAIRIEAASGLIQNNQIGSINSEVRTAAGGMQLLCIYVSGTLPAPLTISGNMVGGTTAHSIQSTTASLGNVNVMGICASGATGSLLTVDNNIVRNLSNLNGTSGTNNAVKGIYHTGAATGGSLITNNNVYNLYSSSSNLGTDQTSALLGITCNNSSGNHLVSGNKVWGMVSGTPSAAVNIAGIMVSGTTTGTITVEKNKLYGYTGATGNSAVLVSGIQLVSTVTTKVSIWNNMISLGNDTSGASYAEAIAISGIQKNGVKAAVLFNTVLIGGTGVGSNLNNTYALNTTANVAGDSVMNNIMINNRTNSSTGGNHYAVRLPNATNVVANYNLYTVAAGNLGLFNAIPQTNLANWQSASTLDVNSVSAAVNLVSTTDLHVTGASVGDLVLKGTPLAYISTDIDNAVRTITPYMGADEGIVPLPVKLVRFTAVAMEKNAYLNWTTASEKDAAYFSVMASADGRTFTEVGRVNAKGQTNAAVNYAFVHSNAREWAGTAAVVYYQLRNVDRDGAVSVSEIVTVHFGDQRSAQAVVFPNPYQQELTILIPATADAVCQVRVTDVSGKEVAVFERNLLAGMNRMDVTELADLGKGIYLLQLSSGGETRTVKLVKE